MRDGWGLGVHGSHPLADLFEDSDDLGFRESGVLVALHEVEEGALVHFFEEDVADCVPADSLFEGAEAGDDVLAWWDSSLIEKFIKNHNFLIFFSQMGWIVRRVEGLK